MKKQVKKRALISVYDKTNLIPFVMALTDGFDYEIVSTGGTAKMILEVGVKVKEVSKVTRFPEMLDGRVKTMHPKIVGGIIADYNNPKHVAQVEARKIKRFHMVVCNLYDFWNDPSIEQIDVGGPSMLRAAAKNCESCLPVTDPDDYNLILEEMRKNGGTIGLDFRLEMAQKVWELTSAYDHKIALWWKKHRKRKVEHLKDKYSKSSALT